MSIYQKPLILTPDISSLSFSVIQKDKQYIIGACYSEFPEMGTEYLYDYVDNSAFFIVEMKDARKFNTEIEAEIFILGIL